jgi:hypothetical protein
MTSVQSALTSTLATAAALTAPAGESADASNPSATASGKPEGKGFFDLHVLGLGYLNRIREVKPTRGQPFLACQIAALSGPKDAVEYRYFDVKVSGSEAIRVITEYQQAVKDDRKVLIGFRLGDLWVDQFTYTRGEKQGQQGVQLKARLLFISWLRIDGDTVYRAESRFEPEVTRPDDIESVNETSYAGGGSPTPSSAQAD